MSKRIMLMFAVPALFLIVSTTSCNSKTSDADVKTAVDKAIAANAGPSTVSTSVNDGVVDKREEVRLLRRDSVVAVVEDIANDGDLGGVSTAVAA